MADSGNVMYNLSHVTFLLLVVVFLLNIHRDYAIDEMSIVSLTFYFSFKVNDTDTGSEDDIILLDELSQDDLESLASDVHPSGTRRSQGSTSQKLFSEEVSQEPVRLLTEVFEVLMSFPVLSF